VSRKASVALVAVASIGHLIAYLVAAPEHVVDGTWPLHARFHVFQALLWTVGFDTLVLLIAVGPHRRGERWAFWTLAGAWPLLHIGYFIALGVIPGGGPSTVATAIMGTLAALYGAGLALGLRRGG
jgi:hypothetical protein